jgi:TBC1 domain family member 10
LGDLTALFYSYEEGSTGLRRPGNTQNGVAPPAPYGAPRANRSISSSSSQDGSPPKRTGHAPSPLSLPQNNSAMNLGGTNGGVKPPRSPTAPRSPTPLRQVTSRSNFNDALAPAKPHKLQKQQSMQSVINQSSRSGDVTGRAEDVVSPQPSIGRQSSLRSKLSLPNLRRGQGSISNLKDITQPPETVQVKDMDFEMVRPTISRQMQRSSSEDSRRSMDVRAPSMDSRSRSDSPALSSILSNSGQVGQLSSEAFRNARSSDSESSADAHRQRELKWVTLMSQVPPAQARKSKKMRKLLMDGVPSSVRYLVWSHLMDGKAKNVPGVYAQYSKRGSVPASDQIATDIKRCFKDNSQLLNTQGPIVGILEAYFNMVPDIEYRIGIVLAFIASHI